MWLCCRYLAICQFCSSAVWLFGYFAWLCGYNSWLVTPLESTQTMWHFSEVLLFGTKISVSLNCFTKISLSLLPLVILGFVSTFQLFSAFVRVAFFPFVVSKVFLPSSQPSQQSPHSLLRGSFWSFPVNRAELTSEGKTTFRSRWFFENARRPETMIKIWNVCWYWLLVNKLDH